MHDAGIVKTHQMYALAHNIKEHKSTNRTDMMEREEYYFIIQITNILSLLHTHNSKSTHVRIKIDTHVHNKRGCIVPWNAHYKDPSIRNFSHVGLHIHCTK